MAAANEPKIAKPSARQEGRASYPTPVVGVDKLVELSVTNPAPDSSPSREPTGTYMIISFD